MGRLSGLLFSSTIKRSAKCVGLFTMFLLLIFFFFSAPIIDFGGSFWRVKRMDNVYTLPTVFLGLYCKTIGENREYFFNIYKLTVSVMLDNFVCNSV